MKITVRHLSDGLPAPSDITVVIDVFRDFTAAAFLMQNHAAGILPVADEASAKRISRNCPDAVLCGEQDGNAIDGFDYRTSPALLKDIDFSGKQVVLLCAGAAPLLAAASLSGEVLFSSLVTAKATTAYIRSKNPKVVTLLCAGKASAADSLCASYLKSLLVNNPANNLVPRIAQLKYTEETAYFDPSCQARFPEQDFRLCTDFDRFDFTLRLKKGISSAPWELERVAYTGPEPAIEYTQVSPGDMMSQFTEEQVIAFPDAVKRAVCYGNYTEPEGCFDAAFVLGCNPTKQKSRAAAAAKLYHDGRCKLLIPTGGVKWETEMGYLSECDSMAQYMLEMGVPESAIMRENQATTTHENMVHAKALLASRMDLSAARIAVVTSYNHVRRGTLLSKLHIPEAEHVGVRAEYPNDNPEQYLKDFGLTQAVTTECRLLHENVVKGLIPDFPVL